jgi:hypothetical protein
MSADCYVDRLGTENTLGKNFLESRNTSKGLRDI